MRRRRWARGGRTAIVIGAVALALTGCSAKDWGRNLRFGFPTGVTKQETEIRVLWTWAGVTAPALGAMGWGLTLWCLIRYHKRPDDFPRQTKYNFTDEAVFFTF